MHDQTTATYGMPLQHGDRSPQKKATLTSNIGALRHGKRSQHQKKPALTKFNGAHLLKWVAAFCMLDCVGAAEPYAGCTVPIDVVLVLDDSGSIDTSNSTEAVKNFSKAIVRGFNLGDDLSRVAVVTFASDATLRTGLSTELNTINDAIDKLTGSADFSQDGPDARLRLTSISDSLKLAQQVFEDEATPATAC